MANFTSQQAGEWNDSSTWGSGYPGSSDCVTVCHAVTVDGTGRAGSTLTVDGGSLTVTTGGALTLTSVVSGVPVVAAGGTLTAGDGTVDCYGTAYVGIAGTGTIVRDGGYLELSEYIPLTERVTLHGGGTVKFHKQYQTGDVPFDGVLTGLSATKKAHIILQNDAICCLALKDAQRSFLHLEVRDVAGLVIDTDEIQDVFIEGNVVIGSAKVSRSEVTPEVYPSVPRVRTVCCKGTCRFFGGVANGGNDVLDGKLLMVNLVGENVIIGYDETDTASAAGDMLPEEAPAFEISTSEDGLDASACVDGRYRFLNLRVNSALAFAPSRQGPDLVVRNYVVGATFTPGAWRRAEYAGVSERETTVVYAPRTSSVKVSPDTFCSADTTVDHEFSVPVALGQTVTATAQVRVNSTYGTTAGNFPKLVVDPAGSVGAKAQAAAPATVTADAWTELTVSHATTAAGTCTVRFSVPHGAAGAAAYFGDLVVEAGNDRYVLDAQQLVLARDSWYAEQSATRTKDETEHEVNWTTTGSAPDYWSSGIPAVGDPLDDGDPEDITTPICFEVTGAPKTSGGLTITAKYKALKPKVTYS